MPLYLAAADVLVLPYLRGSQSAVAPLALASGLPVVTTAVGGVPEIVVDGENGLVVPAGDPAAITAALESLSRERLSVLSAGASRSAERLSWDDYAAGLESLIQRIT
jgi:2-deoxystreptamine N-acetyl-D-glucosaminyltransferase/2-deoxystreptamine glucosyltransferase